MDEYCNEITYNKKWDTKENNKKVNALLKKYNTAYWSDCPYSWVNEVSGLLNSIDKKYGIAKNDSGLVKGFPINTKEGKEFIEKNKAYNEKRKPKVRLDQFKEKFGTLRVYFNCDEYVKREIDKMVDTCEVQLTQKLRYPYPVYICSDCGKKQLTWTTNDKNFNTKLCKYCGKQLTNGKQTTKIKKIQTTKANKRK